VKKPQFLSAFAILRRMEGHFMDFSGVNSLQKAEALYRAGELERLFLFPLEFGGQEIPQNILYVPPGIAAIKQQIDGAIATMVKEGAVSQYTAEPEYKGTSFIPSKIKIATSNPPKPGGVHRTINIW
jgi:hypothetical protein